MRRLTDSEMATLVQMCRDGRKGPARAMEALWDLILFDAEGTSAAEAAARTPPYRVQDYSIAADQAETLYAAITLGRRLPDRVIAGLAKSWAFYAPAEHGQRSDPTS